VVCAALRHCAHHYEMRVMKMFRSATAEEKAQELALYRALYDHPAIAAAARQGGDVKQAPAESPQSGAARQSPAISKGYSTTKGWGG
jgi:hypothetical protein